MSRKIIIRDEAFDDLDAISEIIGQDSPIASLNFLEQAQKAFEFIAEMPGVGSARPEFGDPRFAGLRMWPIPHFRVYLIFYLVTDHAVDIIRVLHGSRDIVAIFSPPQE